MQMSLEGSIVTYTGRRIWPLNPKIEDINLLDICHALSNQCRFTGHTRQFYSVAEHSYRVHDILPNNLKLIGLLHDASEAYLMDLARPVKNTEEMEFFRIAEDNILKCIAEKYNLEYPFPKEIKDADQILLATEYRDLMPVEVYKVSDFNGHKPLPKYIQATTPVKAKSGMMYRLERLGFEVNPWGE